MERSKGTWGPLEETLRTQQFVLFRAWSELIERAGSGLDSRFLRWNHSSLGPRSRTSPHRRGR